MTSYKKKKIRSNIEIRQCRASDVFLSQGGVLAEILTRQEMDAVVRAVEASGVQFWLNNRRPEGVNYTLPASACRNCQSSLFQCEICREHVGLYSWQRSNTTLLETQLFVQKNATDVAFVEILQDMFYLLGPSMVYSTMQERCLAIYGSTPTGFLNDNSCNMQNFVVCGMSRKTFLFFFPKWASFLYRERWRRTQQRTHTFELCYTWYRPRLYGAKRNSCRQV